MKLRNRLFALVLSAALVVTCIPALVFADEIPQSEEPQTEAVQTEEPQAETPAAEETQSDAAQSEDTQTEPAQPAEGQTEEPAPADTPAADTEEPQETKYPEPKDILFGAGEFTGIIGTTDVEGMYEYSNEIDVFYDDGTNPDESYIDGTMKEYVYGLYTYKDINGKTVEVEGFLLKGGDPSKEYNYAYVSYNDQGHVFTEGENEIILDYLIPYVARGDGSVDSDYEWKEIHAVNYLYCAYDLPTEIRFIPAANFKSNAVVGYNYINEEALYGEGNVIEVDYKKRPIDPDYPNFGYTAEYKYVKTKTDDGIVEGFYESGNINLERLDLTEGIEGFLKKGINKVTIPYTEYVPVLAKEVTLQLTCDLNVTKLDAYANTPIFNYTGKAITKKAFTKRLVVRDTTGSKIPASAYTVSFKGYKKMGWYEVTINFKDKNKYVSSITGYYGIGPKAPISKKPKAGKKKLTVRWKKFSKSQLKKIDGMYIELATDKNFTQNFKVVKVSKKTLKKGYKSIKKLKGGKKYYVRMYTYKKIKQGGENFYMYSDYSKTKVRKTRK